MSTQLNYREAVNKVYSSLKGKKRRIADRLLSAPERMIEKSIAEFAAECQCDQTTIVRFAQLLGYSGYAELKLAAARQLETLWQDFAPERSSGDQPEDHAVDSLRRLHCESITGTFRNLDLSVIREVVVRLGKAKHIMICGSGTSALAAEDLHIKLSRQGIHSYFFRDVEMWKTFIGYLGSGDLLILFSSSGETPEILELAKTAARKKIPTAGIVSFPGSTLAKSAEYTILTENRGELPIRLGAMTSRTSQFMIADLLTILYGMRDKDRSWDFLEKSYV